MLTPADHLVSCGCRTKSTQIFVLFSFRQNQEEALAHGHGSAALWAIEFGSVKFPERFRLAGVLGCRRLLIYEIPGLHGRRIFRTRFISVNIVPWLMVVKEGTGAERGVGLEDPSGSYESVQPKPSLLRLNLNRIDREEVFLDIGGVVSWR